MSLPSSILISAEELAVRLNDDRWVVVDCRYDLGDSEGGSVAYLEGHIPSARYADLGKDLAAPPGDHGGRHPLPEPHLFAAKLSGWGISNHTRIAVYDDQDGIFAARLWWMFRWIGHETVWVLDGGLGAWEEFSGSLEKGLPDWTPADFSFHQAHHEWVATVQEIPALLERGSILLDARLEDRYHGVSEPIDHVAGHVPGAINYPFILNLKNNGQFHEPSVLKEKFVRSFDEKNHDLIAMCGSGVTACHLLLALKIAGFADGRLFVGSWSEWIRDPNRPIRVGPDP